MPFSSLTYNSNKRRWPCRGEQNICQSFRFGVIERRYTVEMATQYAHEITIASPPNRIAVFLLFVVASDYYGYVTRVSLSLSLKGSLIYTIASRCLWSACGNVEALQVFMTTCICFVLLQTISPPAIYLFNAFPRVPLQTFWPREKDGKDKLHGTDIFQSKTKDTKGIEMRGNQPDTVNGSSVILLFS
jgi:hypothetical protein